MNLLLRQFTEGRYKSLLTEYTKIIGHKSSKQIDLVIPGLTQNLFSASQNFVDAVINLDDEFIESTATHALQRKLLSDIKQLKKSNISITTSKFKNKLQQVLKPQNKQGAPQQQDLKRFIISPYVIFGQDINQRYKKQQPWQGMAPIFGLNRFVYINSSEGFSLEKLRNLHIYGFNCHYFNLNRSFSMMQNGKNTQYDPKEFIVTFETDSVNHQFFVSDFNYVVKNRLQ